MVLELMKGYGVGEKVWRMFEVYWKHQEVALRQDGYYGRTFNPDRGVTQWDIASLTLFNLVIDVV